ncbi:MAG: PAS domain S-box protein [Thermodesulfobacteriota bacterium]
MMQSRPDTVPWRRSLRFKLVIAAIAVELVMLSALLFNSFRLLDEAVQSQARARLESLSPLLDAALAGRVFQRDHAEVQAIITRLTTSPTAEINYITVLDPTGRIIASTAHSLTDELPGQDHSVTDALLDLTYDVRLPLTIIGNEVGSVSFGLSLASMVATKDRVVREGMIIAAVEILLSMLLLASGGYLITRHIRALTEGTRRLARGDYTARIRITGSDEIAELADHFNVMSAAIADQVSSLRESEMRFAAIFNAVGEAIFVQDAATGRILDVNQRMCEMFDCSREKALNSDIGVFSSGTSPYTLDTALARIRAVRLEGPQRFDWQSRACDGRLFWSEVSLSLVKMGDDDRLLAVVRDISERKRAEEEKNTAIARFRTLVDSLDALVYVADLETHEILFINKYGREVWGEVEGRICWQALQDGQTGPCAFCTNDKLLDAAGKPIGTIVTLIHNTATREWYECRDQAIEWTDGRLVRMEIAINITRRKLAEDALAAEKQQLAVTLRSIGDGVITTDTDSRIVLLNSVAETLTGWSQAEAHGRSLDEVFPLIHARTGARCANPVERVLASGRITEFADHTVLVTRDGRQRLVADSGAPIRDEQGQIVGVVLVFRDVSEKQRMEEELLKIKKLESVGVLAGGIAHDFNNILAAILGNINLALLDADLGEKTRFLLGSAEKASVRAKELTRQLLTFSKGGEPVRETASIAEIIRDSAEFVLHGGNVACRYVIADDLWLVNIDKGQISQVIQNIIINAKQAMPSGGVIEVRCENVVAGETPDQVLTRPGRYVSISIRDTGPGMAADVVEKIFDPYFTTKEEGSGLGLAITHSIIGKHGGFISVESAPGQGTLFTILLPVSSIAAEKEKDEDEGAAQVAGANILLMDDEEMVRNVAAAMLARLGHHVTPARDGAEAVALYRQGMESGEPFDLVIMDLTIPGGMGGKDAVRLIRTVDPAARVIVASGYSSDPIMAHCREYGFAAAIVKPFQLHDIDRIISDLLRR